MEESILKIGVTGSAGSGKSLVCEGFQKLGLVTLDCDVIARQVVEPGQAAYKKVVKAFGQGVLTKDLTLDRAGLRNIIVDKPELRKKLEAILHPAIIKEMVQQMKTADYIKEPACAVEVPLLFELDMAGHFDCVVVVTAKDEHLVERIAARDGVNIESAQKILDIQMPQGEKIKRADHVVKNTGDKNELFESIAVLYQKLVKQRLTKKS